jgi:DNA mismatch repair protein MutS
MAQWFACKQAQPDALLFFRMGDFYELFFDDAETAASVLGLALTARGEHAGKPIALCGVPAHAMEGYLLRLIRRGFRVAIAEQMERAQDRAGKAPIRREIVRLITPGTLTEDSLLEAGRANRLLALAQPGAGAGAGSSAGAGAGAGPGPGPGGTIGAAWLDVSTGTFETQDVARDNLPALLARLDPAEILAPAGLPLDAWEARRAPETSAPPPLVARRQLAEAFAVASLDALGVFSDAEAMAAALALEYARAAAAGKLPLLSPPRAMGGQGRMEMDASTRASLEIVRARDGGPHTALAAVRRTLTAPGARLLEEHISSPLAHLDEIIARQDAWSWLLSARPGALSALRQALRQAPDLSRALSRLSLGRGGPRDLAAVGAGLEAAAAARAALGVEPSLPPVLLAVAAERLDPAPGLAALLRAALVEPAPVRVDQGAIAENFDGELDAERRLRDDSRRVIAGLQLDYAQRYGVAALKIRHHAQIGYCIEVPAAATEALRAHPELVLRQGMASGARFTSPELSELDRRIAEAGERADARERVVFDHLVRRVLDHAASLAGCATALAELDVAQSAASLAAAGSWCRPALSEDGAFVVRAGRHPVVEAALAGQTRFVPNDCDLGPGRQVLLLTGPNMAGKSTFLRQNALIVVLAQAGQPVPAAEARVGLVDRLYSRIGAADDLARGRSTFMAEMVETAAILNTAGPRSLVVVDEIGRGTATLDGLAIAWAVLEALHDRVRCRTIFATHFHELASLRGELPRLSPHTMRVKEYAGDVVFLHEVAEGAAGRSWGVHVAKLAGVPAPVVRRAGSLLAALDHRAGRLTDAAALPLFATLPADAAPAASENATDPVYEALREVDPDTLSPRDALALFYRLRALVAVNAVAEPLTSS